MAQAATITVNDRMSTPVAHAFVPRGTNGQPGFYQFVEAGTVPAGDRTLTFRWRKSNGKFYIRVVYTGPVMVTETINGVGVPSVQRVELIDTTFRFADTSTEQERNNAVGMYFNAFGPLQAVVMSAVVKLEGIWG